LKKKKICPFIDALSGLFYIAEYDNKLNCIIPPKMIEEKELKNYKNLISNENENKNILSPETLLELTHKKIESCEFIEESELVPLYLRQSQAEVELNAKNKKIN
jgi:tRNA A37 threonylcarbamoyladenosine modification protein TsaB